jgi:hypothetical protein
MSLPTIFEVLFTWETRDSWDTGQIKAKGERQKAKWEADCDLQEADGKVAKVAHLQAVSLRLGSKRFIVW